MNRFGKHCRHHLFIWHPMFALLISLYVCLLLLLFPSIFWYHSIIHVEMENKTTCYISIDIWKCQHFMSQCLVWKPQTGNVYAHEEIGQMCLVMIVDDVQLSEDSSLPRIKFAQRSSQRWIPLKWCSKVQKNWNRSSIVITCSLITYWRWQSRPATAEWRRKKKREKNSRAYIQGWTQIRTHTHNLCSVSRIIACDCRW